MPKDYIFPSFMAFVLWGPFAPKEKQLTLFLLGKYNPIIVLLFNHTLTQYLSFFHICILDDAPSSITKSRAQRKKDLKVKKTSERDTDTSSIRGFSTDQRICILSMNIDKKRLQHEKNEALMASLSIHQAALAKQLESAETRAESRCPKYKATNMYWKRVDELFEEHDQLVKTIRERTMSLFKATDNEVVEEEVNDFLNQKSPVAKRKYKDLVECGDGVKLFDIEESIDTDTNVDVSLEVKEEKLKNVSSLNKKKRKR